MWHADSSGKGRDPEQQSTSDEPLLDAADREFFLGVYRSAVAFYKPKIEARTGISLGNIEVRDYACLQNQKITDQLHGFRRRLTLLVLKVLFGRALPEVTDMMAAESEKVGRRCGAVYYNRGIYVSFSSGTLHQEAVALLAVHELGHALWESLAGKPLHEKRVAKPLQAEYEIFVEGFATYAERVWFLDFYPALQRRAVPHLPIAAGPYMRGFRRIERLVKQHGSQILWEIPRRWRSL